MLTGNTPPPALLKKNSHLYEILLRLQLYIRGKKDIDIDVHRICKCGNAVGKSLSTAATLP